MYALKNLFRCCIVEKDTNKLDELEIHRSQNENSHPCISYGIIPDDKEDKLNENLLSNENPTASSMENFEEEMNKVFFLEHFIRLEERDTISFVK